ncbi:MAG: ApbE family lipoprotein [Desulfobulbus propionicus]|nr:MAG: ApbE family lipoprotein [Desulfobulbus propionicus]
MGTFVTLTAFHPSRDEAEEAIGEAFLLIHRLGQELSRHSSSSPLAALNRDGRLTSPPQSLQHVITRALHWHKRSGGCFDITVKPIIDLYEGAFADKTVPDAADIAAATELTGSQYLRLSRQEIVLDRTGMGVTLDGIAKGYIVDAASNFLHARGIVNHLVNAGGDMRARGRAAQEKPWTIAIEDPKKKGRYPQVVHMTDGAIATSGNYEIYYDKERLYHHIVDPASGMSPSAATSATVTAPVVMDADALATAAMVLGPQEATSLIDTLSGCASLLIDPEEQLFPSSSWRVDLRH